MDELTNAGRALRERREFDPSPIETIERRLRRRRQHQRRLFAAVVAVVVVVGGAIAAVAATNGNGPKERIVTTQPPVTPPPSTTPTTHAPTTITTRVNGKTGVFIRFLPRFNRYRAGPFDVVEYRLGATYRPSGPLTLTPGAVWFANGRKLLRFEPATRTVHDQITLDGDITELTSSPNTIYAVTSGRRVVAINATTMRIVWNVDPASTPPLHIALGANALWVAGQQEVREGLGTGTAPGTLRPLELASGREVLTDYLPAAPIGLVVAPTAVSVGSTTSLVRIGIGVNQPVTTFHLGGAFTPMGMTADNTGAWGTLQTGPYTTDVHLVLVSAKDGRVLATVPYDANGFAPVTDREAWFTADVGVLGVLDMSATKVTQTGNAHTVSSNGPINLHVLNGVGWAVNTMASRLVRIEVRR